MTKYLLAAAVAGTLSTLIPGAPASAAIEYPWCAQYGGRSGGRNCGFVSFQQCEATRIGMGGFCEPNLFYTPTRSRRELRR
jgi:hypothetical protein